MIAISSPVWVDAANRLHLRVSDGYHWNTAPGWGWLLICGFIFGGLSLVCAGLLAAKR